jgi:diketogulonate reductase-like aldo/keto reductase
MIAEHFVTSAYCVRMPKLLYGTAWKKTRTAALVETAIRQGFRAIDTACQPKHYDEPGVGAGVAACLSRGLSRSDLYLQTKFTPLSGQDPRRIPYEPTASLAKQVEQSLQVSLRNLRTEYLDCLVLHSPLAEQGQFTQVWQAMEAIFDSGATRQLGVSNCYDLKLLDWLYSDARVKPAVLQNRFYAQTHYDGAVRAYCREHQIFYQSFWTLTANPHVLAHQTIQELASRYARTPAQVLLRYLTLVDVLVLTGTTSEQHMREDLAIFDFELTQSECDTVSKLFE